MKIAGLNTWPNRFPRLEVEPWFSMGVRSMKVRRHRVLYLVVEERKEVIILGVKYARMDFGKMRV